ncbi:hypothetical protein QQP08_010979 [Theobroma cacao]|nr:hypothetical protein QQP08_010979 [Theobroma cacao]
MELPSLESHPFSPHKPQKVHRQILLLPHKALTIALLTQFQEQAGLRRGLWKVLSSKISKDLF